MEAIGVGHHDNACDGKDGGHDLREGEKHCQAWREETLSGLGRRCKCLRGRKFYSWVLPDRRKQRLIPRLMGEKGEVPDGVALTGHLSKLDGTKLLRHG